MSLNHLVNAVGSLAQTAPLELRLKRSLIGDLTDAGAGYILQVDGNAWQEAVVPSYTLKDTASVNAPMAWRNNAGRFVIFDPAGVSGTDNLLLYNVTGTRTQGLEIWGDTSGSGVGRIACGIGSSMKFGINADDTDNLTKINSDTGLVFSIPFGSTDLYVAGPPILGESSAITAGGSIVCRFNTGASGPAILTGSGAPSLAAPQGSIYLRSDGSSTSTRIYVNTDGSSGWTNLTSGA